MTLSPPHLFRFLAPLAVFAALFAVLMAVNGGGAPSLGVSADPGAPTGDAVADFQRAVRAAPDNADAYAGLGSAYLARARETGDPGYYSRAEQAFEEALRRKPSNLGALIGSGTLAGLRHDFRRQLVLGRRAAAVAPQLARPLTVIADAQIELGRYGAAERSIQRLVDAKPGLAAYSRASYYRELSGDTAGAIEAMRLAASAGGAPENVAYVQALLGDLELQRGRVGAARLEQALGHPAAAAAALDTARAQQRLYRAAATAPDAEAVLFEADHGSPAAAVALGRRVWRAAPSVRSADALGWALTRADRPPGTRSRGAPWRSAHATPHSGCTPG